MLEEVTLDSSNLPHLFDAFKVVSLIIYFNIEVICVFFEIKIDNEIPTKTFQSNLNKAEVRSF